MTHIQTLMFPAKTHLGCITAHISITLCKGSRLVRLYRHLSQSVNYAIPGSLRWENGSKPHVNWHLFHIWFLNAYCIATSRPKTTTENSWWSWSNLFWDCPYVLHTSENYADTKYKKDATLPCQQHRHLWITASQQNILCHLVKMFTAKLFYDKQRGWESCALIESYLPRMHALVTWGAHRKSTQSWNRIIVNRCNCLDNNITKTIERYIWIWS